MFSARLCYQRRHERHSIKLLDFLQYNTRNVMSGYANTSFLYKINSIVNKKQTESYQVVRLTLIIGWFNFIYTVSENWIMIIENENKNKKQNLSRSTIKSFGWMTQPPNFSKSMLCYGILIHYL